MPEKKAENSMVISITQIADMLYEGLLFFRISLRIKNMAIAINKMINSG